jgi:arylsulfatase A-like enzyme
LDKVRDGNPFFLFLNYMDAHTPYIPPAEVRDRFVGRDLLFKPVARHESLTLGVNSRKFHLQPAEQRHLISQYDAGISYIDSAIAALLGRLRTQGLYENTMIIVTADHGEAFGEHNYMQHANGSVYQDQVHIPLLVKYPGQQEARRVEALVSQVDLMPTVLEAAGLPPLQGIQGQSLNLPRTGSAAVFTEARAMGSQQTDNPRFRGVRRAIFSGSSKLIAWSHGPSEFYDLVADPGELRNKFATDDTRQSELAAQLTQWISAIPKITEPVRKLDKPSMERLKSLGYTQ